MVAPKLCECGCGQPAPLAAKTGARLGHLQGQPVRFICGHATRGRRLTGDHRAKISASLRGHPVTASTRAKIAATKRGRVKHTVESRQRISVARRGKYVGADHYLWRGEAVGYGGLHAWVARHKTKTGVCTECGRRVGTERFRGTQWANISGRYLRDLDDFIELCMSCHARRDQARAAERRRPAAE
jgi:hypothetical protein